MADRLASRPKNTADIDARLVVLIGYAGAIADQATGLGEITPAIDCGYGMARSECHKDCASVRKQRVV